MSIKTFVAKIERKISFRHAHASKLNLTHDKNGHGNVKNENINQINDEGQRELHETSEEQSSFEEG